MRTSLFVSLHPLPVFYFFLVPYLQSFCFLLIYLEPILRETEVQLNMKDDITIGIHVNISAFAPFYQVSQFLYYFVVFGIIWDETTGEMLALPPNIRWMVSNLNFNNILYI